MWISGRWCGRHAEALGEMLSSQESSPTEKIIYPTGLFTAHVGVFCLFVSLLFSDQAFCRGSPLRW